MRTEKVYPLLWFIFAVYALITFSSPFFKIPVFLFAGLVVSLGAIFALIHGSLRYGVKGMAIFIIFCLVISNILENLSIYTGFPFGLYHYTGGLGPKLFAVPILIGPAYFSTGYLAWVAADVILGKVDVKLSRFNIISLPVVAAFIMVMWDLVMDPTSSTVSHLWIWHQAGGFFGVPLSNYLGWFLTVYLFFQAFAIYLGKNQRIIKEVLPQTHWYQAVFLYLVIGLSVIPRYLAGHAARVADATGFIWSQSAINESAVVISLYTMCFVGVLALIRLKNFS